MKESNPAPPRWAQRFFEWYCSPELVEDLQGDLFERFYKRSRESSPRKARLYYILDVLAFFQPYVIRRKQNPEYTPRYRMFIKHYLTIAFRNLKRDKQYLAVNTIGLSVGFACSLLLIAYIYTEFSFDRDTPNADEIYRISCSTLIDGVQTDFAPIPPAVGPALKETLPEVKALARLMIIHGTTTLKHHQEAFSATNLFFADSTVFNVFTHRFILGDKNALHGKDRIVITESLKEKIFGSNNSDENVLDQPLEILGQTFIVTAVIEDVPYNSHLRPTAYIGWHGYGQDDVWDDSHAYTYALMQDGTDAAAVQQKVENFVSTNENLKAVAEAFGAKVRVYIQPVTDLHFCSNKMYELAAGGNINYVYAFGLISLFFLLSSGINYTNLAIVASAHRHREIGVRKVMGANQVQLVKQFMTESFVIILLSSALGAIIFYISIPGFNSLMGSELSVQLLLNIKFAMYAILVILLLAMASGFYPSLYLSKFNPVNVLKNKFSGANNRFSIRKVLLVTQFAISSLMIVAVTVVSRQMNFLDTKDLGFSNENVMIISMNGSQFQSLATLKQELSRTPGVFQTSTAEYLPGNGSFIDEHRIERSNGEMRSATIARIFIDKDYLKLLGLKIVQGRDFDPDNEADYENSFLVNEATVKAYGWDKTPNGAIGKKIDGFNYGKQGVVVGVVKDANLFSLKQKIEPLIFNMTPQAGNMYVKVEGANMPANVSAIEAAYKKIFPNDTFEFQFLDEQYDKLYDTDRRMNLAMTRGAQILILISCIGLFALSAFLIAKRTKEIGIRKVLGASIREIALLLSRDYITLIIVANVIALPIAYFTMSTWLKVYAYSVDFSFWILAIPLAVTIVLAMLSISYHIVRVSKANPVNELRAE